MCFKNMCSKVRSAAWNHSGELMKKLLCLVVDGAAAAADLLIGG